MPYWGMIKDGLYHREIGLPAGASRLWTDPEWLQMVYSEHALRAAEDDRYGRVPLYREMAFAPEELVEVEYQNGQPVKAVFRTPLEDVAGNKSPFDLVIVMLPPERDGKVFVKTVWYNVRSDGHRTLRRHLYNSL